MNKSDHLAHIRSIGNKQQFHLLPEYARGVNFDHAERIVKSLENTDTYGLYESGQILVEMAFNEPDVDKSFNYFSRADKQFMRVLENGFLNFEFHNSAMSKAAIQLAFSEANTYMKITGELPPNIILSQTNQRLTGIANIMVNSWQKLNESIKRHTKELSPLTLSLRNEWGAMVGAMAEASVIMMLTKWGLENLDEDQSRFVVPSLSSEDHHYSRGYKKSGISPWDVSVYTAYAENDQPGEPELTYRLQVKYGMDTNPDVSNSDTVTFVPFRRILQTAHENRNDSFRPSTVLREIISTDQAKQKRLAWRTDQLIDYLN